MNSNTPEFNDIYTRLRDLATKWKHANVEVHDVCRDAAEELRVLRLKLSHFEELSKPKFYPYHELGWGKGKDE
jgi:hypothetical protein